MKMSYNDSSGKGFYISLLERFQAWEQIDALIEFGKMTEKEHENHLLDRALYVYFTLQWHAALHWTSINVCLVKIKPFCVSDHMMQFHGQIGI